VSFVDGLMVANRHQNKHELPFAPGMEVAGEVIACGEGVTGISIGDRVAALVYDGGWASVAVADATEVFALPDAVEGSVAAASLSVYLTSYLALTDVAQLEDGETLLVTGAAGGVGLGAVEIGAALGADVIACASTEAKLDAARAHGARLGVLYGADHDLREALSENCPNGTDVVLDPVAGEVYEPTFRSLGWGGRYVSVGFAGGAIPQIPANLLLVKNRSARGFILMYYRRYRHDLLQAAAQQLFGWMADGVINPRVANVAPLAEAPRLLEEINARTVMGKSVLTLD
jgi:NADPH2:quinone reductase